MEIKWFSAKEKEGVVSMYATHIDLNTIAAIPFQYAYRVQIGVNEKGQVVISCLNKDKVLSGELDEYTLYKPSINKSYTRISSTDLMKNISAQLNISLDKKIPIKYSSTWDDDNNVLIILDRKE